ncbi:MAG: hypothetical protein HC905_15910 [Bacteroidales bacterium]|nr:hypothetical protein [Bacteroidales bacterium]
MLNYAGYHSGWAKTLCDLTFPIFEVAVTGPEAVNKVLELESHYLPHILICGSPVESFLPLLEHRYRPGETWIYVCENQTCKLPATKTEVVLQQLSGQLQT